MTECRVKHSFKMVPKWIIDRNIQEITFSFQFLSACHRGGAPVFIPSYPAFNTFCHSNVLLHISLCSLFIRLHLGPYSSLPFAAVPSARRRVVPGLARLCRMQLPANPGLDCPWMCQPGSKKHEPGWCEVRSMVNSRGRGSIAHLHQTKV